MRRAPATTSLSGPRHRLEADSTSVILGGPGVANLVGQGSVVKTEKTSHVAFQKSFGRSVKVRAPGALVAILRQKTAATGGDLVEFPTRTTRLGQYDHTTGAYTKKPLSQRVHVLGDGAGVVQRELYSAFLARFVEADTLDARSAAEAFRSAKPLLRRAAPGEQHAPASGVGFPHPHALWRVPGCRSKKNGDGVAETARVSENNGRADTAASGTSARRPRQCLLAQQDVLEVPRASMIARLGRGPRHARIPGPGSRA
ncbi:MAG TPA: hypothetical protein VMK12_31680 [Anaeromyxobacteraceae bacterium]|nr:hypothetical protein [Anaeromyxobacteraceae bacterium]